MNTDTTSPAQQPAAMQGLFDGMPLDQACRAYHNYLDTFQPDLPMALGILAVAANTSFAGFPRIAAILSADGFLPRQLANLGDRLVYKNGIVLLALMSGLLIVVFGGNSHALVPLFAVGAFSAFILSQAGMVRHWLRTREPG